MIASGNIKATETPSQHQHNNQHLAQVPGRPQAGQAGRQTGRWQGGAAVLYSLLGGKCEWG